VVAEGGAQVALGANAKTLVPKRSACGFFGSLAMKNRATKILRFNTKDAEFSNMNT
jgi:hypothetical protein